MPMNQRRSFRALSKSSEKNAAFFTISTPPCTRPLPASCAAKIRLAPAVPAALQPDRDGTGSSLAQERGLAMRSRNRKSRLQRYRNMPSDAVLALLYEGQDEECFDPARRRQEKRSQ